MEDITSSKQPLQHHNHQQSLYSMPAELAASADDSDADSATLNSSISEDFNEAAANTEVVNPPRVRRFANAGGESDSDADVLDISYDDSIVMKKSVDALRNAAETSKRNTLLGKLGRKAEAAEWPISLRKRHTAASQSNLHLTKGSAKYVDIESGVEITEEMTLPMPKVTSTTNHVEPKVSPMTPKEYASDDDLFVDVVEEPPKGSLLWWPNVYLKELPNKRSILFYVLIFVGCWWFEVPPFVQGALTCLCSMSMVQAIWRWSLQHMAKYLNERIFGMEEEFKQNRCGPERVAFAVPDYTSMEPLVMGSGKETMEHHPVVKSYEVGLDLSTGNLLI